jgi:hypothetical protein
MLLELAGSLLPQLLKAHSASSLHACPFDSLNSLLALFDLSTLHVVRAHFTTKEKSWVC